MKTVQVLLMATALILGSRAGAQSGDVPAGAVAEDTTTFPFITVRNRTSDTAPGREFGDERGPLAAGWCSVRKINSRALSLLSDRAPFNVPDGLLRVYL